MFESAWRTVQAAAATVAHIVEGGPGREVVDAVVGIGREIGDHDKALGAVGSKIESVASQLGAALARIDALEKSAIGRTVTSAVEASVPGAAAVIGAVDGAKAAIETIDGVICPKHPDAPQTANGCTAAGCTVGPAEQLPKT